jgi:hypothetical protein
MDKSKLRAIYGKQAILNGVLLGNAINVIVCCYIASQNDIGACVSFYAV